jgi:hypothetical protein
LNDRTARRFRIPLVLAISVGIVATIALAYELHVRAAEQKEEPNLAVSEQTVSDARTAGQRGIKYASDFHWAHTPTESLAAPGAKTVQLPHCPPGVTGNEAEYFVYLSGGGAAEAVKVSGGTCKGDGQPGTLVFTTKLPHSGATTLSSASSGLQEASIAARWMAQLAPNFVEGGKVVVPPQEFKIFAPVSFVTRNQTIDFSGSMFECWVSDDACIKIGKASDYNATSNVTLINPRGRPTQVHGRQTMIVDYAQKTRILNLMTMLGVRNDKTYGTFSSYLSVVADQSFLLDGVDTTAGWGLECNATFCGTLIVAPGPFGHPDNAAVGWIKNAVISMQCMGNGIDWQSGNTLRVSDTVIQGYNQFGLRGGQARGGYGTIMMDNVYMEDTGACPNPVGNIGTAGVIVEGSKLSFRGGEGPGGHVPQFAKTGNIRQDYFVVARNPKFGVSNPLYAGFAMTSSSGSVTVTTADIPGATELDLLRITSGATRADAPSGTGDFLVTTSARASACSNGMCTFSDTLKPASSYTIPLPTFFPKLEFWPGALVLSSGGDGANPLSAGTAEIQHMNTYSLSTETNLLGLNGPAVTADDCFGTFGSPIWLSCVTAALPPASLYRQNALVVASKPFSDGGLDKNLKGRINLSSSGSGPSHFITLVDSNFAKTVAHSTNRPDNDPNDTYIGYDQANGNPNSVGLSFGAPISISNYIGGSGDGKTWKERLTSKEKDFAVPVNIASGSTLTVGGGTPISRMKIFTTAAVASAPVGAQSCADVKASAADLGANDQVLGVTPPKALGNLALNAYASAANTVTLHFCNPSSAAVSTPAGQYSFLGVH